MKKNHYNTLGVDPNAKPSEIKRAYRRKAAKAHPDKGGSAAEMSDLSQAYRVLNDPERRLLYDKTGDDDVEPLAKRVEKFLTQAFTEALNSDGPMLECAEQWAREMLNKCKEYLTVSRKALKKLLMRRPLIERADGAENLLHRIVDGNVHQVKQAIAAAEMDRETIEAAMGELKNYTSREPKPEPPPRRPFSPFAGLTEQARADDLSRIDRLMQEQIERLRRGEREP